MKNNCKICDRSLRKGEKTYCGDHSKIELSRVSFIKLDGKVIAISTTKDMRKSKLCWYCQEKPKSEGSIFCEACGNKKTRPLTSGTLIIYNRPSKRK